MTFLLELVGMYILSHMLIVMKYWASIFVLPSVSVVVCEMVEDREVGWQPISVTSLQQLFKMWQFWWQ